MLILALVLWFAVLIPFRIGFEVEGAAWEDLFEVIADVIFLVDIVLNFRTSYIEDGVAVPDGAAASACSACAPTQRSHSLTDRSSLRSILVCHRFDCKFSNGLVR